MSETVVKRRLPMGTRILIGVVAGIAIGVFLGEYAAPFDVVGTIYVGLLQMTVLPYVVISLISKIGGFTPEKAKRLAGRATVVLIALWVISLSAVVLLPLSLPDWQAGSFFSASLVEPPEKLDFVSLYLPTNPFNSLANNVVPAAVLFSMLLGIALITLPGKERLLDPLNVISDALGRISGAIVALSPWGTFALAAGASGRLSPGELMRLAGYVSSYTIGILLLTFVVLPGFVAAFTPFTARQILSKSRSALLTAFATGKLFAVLTIVIEAVRDLLVSQDVPKDEADATADVLVPLAYPFPNAGKILSILFVPFAAWFVGMPLGIEDYPLLLSVGVLSFFGSPVAAIPFLLGMFRLPIDLLALFLVAGIWCARLGDVLGAMHLTAFSVVTAAAERGWVRLRPLHAIRWLGISTVIGVAALVTNHFVVKQSVAGQPPPRNRVVAMDLYNRLVTIVEDPQARPNPALLQAGESCLQRIQRTGELRVGYVAKNPPFSYRNQNGDLVGLDIDIVQRLAWTLGVRLRLVPYRLEDLDQALREDHFDLAVGGIPSSPQNFGHFQESHPYMDLHAALVVEDHRVPEFRSRDTMLKLDRLRIGFVAGGLKIRTGLHEESLFDYAEVPSAEAFLKGEFPDVDALLTTAESGAIYTMLAPQFSVVIPSGLTPVVVPVVFGIQPDAGLAQYLDRWIRIKREDGTGIALHEHWILGKQVQAESPRWSVIRDVFGWGK